MRKKFVFNPITEDLDLIGNLPQLEYDPTNPAPEDAWVLKRAVTDLAPLGSPIGFGLLFSYSSNTIVYEHQLSFRTKLGTTMRVAMTEDEPFLNPHGVSITTESGVSLTTESGEELLTE